MASEDNFEDDWDESFLEEIIQAEELALSKAKQNQNPIISCYLPPLPPQPQPPLQQFQPPPRSDVFSYSPPRELSQRPVDHRERDFSGGRINSAPPSAPSHHTTASDTAKDIEIQRLKKELGRVSKQLTELEHECLELKKDRNKEPDKILGSGSETQIVKWQSSNTETSGHGFSGSACHVSSQEFRNEKASEVALAVQRAKSSSKDIGVQKDLPTHLALSGKLRNIWSGSTDYTFGRNLILKLLAVCATDFRVLFGLMEFNSSSGKIDPFSVETLCDAVPHQNHQLFHASEAAKLLNLYCIVTRISSGTVQLQVLVDALVDLCKVQNVVIIYRSLHILHVLLKHLSGFKRKSQRRENVLVKGLHVSCCIMDPCGARSGQAIVSDGDDDEPCCAHYKLSGLGCTEGASETGDRDTCNAMSPSSLNWFSLFALMCEITTKSNDEGLRMEAASIMNIVLLGSVAYHDRVKFCSILTFKSLSKALRRGAGVRLQKEAVILLYLLLNSPKILDSFCSGLKNGEIFGAVDDKQGNSASEHFPIILEGLADCITCCGNGFQLQDHYGELSLFIGWEAILRNNSDSVQELDLRRSTIILLAFLASSGKSGFEILVGHKLYSETNFLALIMQQLASELDAEVTVSTGSGDIFRARTLLIREVLILLNRLVSSSAYSTSVLRALTNSRDIASLTIDIANRLSRNDQKGRESDDMVRKMRESEIVDLGRAFKKRVHAFLGDNRG